MTHLGASSSHFRISSQPSFDKFTFRKSGADRIVLTADTCSLNSDVTVTGALTVSHIPASIQPQLSSVADGNGFRSVLGHASASNKLKAISGSSGCKVTSLFDSIPFSGRPTVVPRQLGLRVRWQIGPIRFHTGDRQQVGPVFVFQGWRLACWGCIQCPCPRVFQSASGSQIMFSTHPKWTTTTTYLDIFATRAGDGTEFWLNRIDCKAPLGSTAANGVQSGSQVLCIASNLSPVYDGGTIVIRVRGTGHF